MQEKTLLRKELIEELKLYKDKYSESQRKIFELESQLAKFYSHSLFQATATINSTLFGLFNVTLSTRNADKKCMMSRQMSMEELQYLSMAEISIDMVLSDLKNELLRQAKKDSK